MPLRPPPLPCDLQSSMQSTVSNIVVLLANSCISKRMTQATDSNCYTSHIGSRLYHISRIYSRHPTNLSSRESGSQSSVYRSSTVGVEALRTLSAAKLLRRCFKSRYKREEKVNKFSLSERSSDFNIVRLWYTRFDKRNGRLHFRGTPPAC